MLQRSALHQKDVTQNGTVQYAYWSSIARVQRIALHTYIRVFAVFLYLGLSYYSAVAYDGKPYPDPGYPRYLCFGQQIGIRPKVQIWGSSKQMTKNSEIVTDLNLDK